MAKNIIFCADGTWNGVIDQNNNTTLGEQDQVQVDLTNVYKFFVTTHLPPQPPRTTGKKALPFMASNKPCITLTPFFLILRM